MSAPATTDLQERAINTIRTLSIDMVEKANSGHPGLPMGAAAMAYTLWTRHLQHNPQNPDWHNRDRFILSAGHGSVLLYTLLHLTGYDLSLDDLKQFRQWGSKTPGHPEYHDTPGVETTTGPLGQGAGNAVGMALAEAFLAEHFNTDAHNVVDHYTYALVSDGDIMEGIANEAASLAGHWGLGKLIYLYDANDITLDGDANMTFSEDVGKRYEAQGWHVLHIEDGNDVEAIDAAINEAKSVTDKPSILIIKTIIGYGSPNQAGTSSAHGSPLGDEEVRLTKEQLGVDPDKTFYVPDDVYAHFREAVDNGAQAESDWNATYDAWKAANAELAQQYETAFAGELPAHWADDIPTFGEDRDPLRTRESAGDVLRGIAKNVPTMIGGDADLAGSTKTLLKGEAHTGQGKPAARNVRYGVREHAMGAITNGLALHGGITKPYSATFLVFSDYMRPSLRLAALMDLPTVHVFTHDSIGLGEDGPTHQPVEHVMSLRMIPHMHVFRPADANESAGAWKAIMQLEHPACIIGTRQDVPILLTDNEEGIHEGVARGAYVLAESPSIKKGRPEVILLASGSEVHLALEAYEALDSEGVKVRVVSMPCWELYEAQDEGYKEFLLPEEVTARVSIEAGSTLGWQKYVGSEGITIGVDSFGASAPYPQIYEKYGLTAEAIVEAVGELVYD